MTTRTIVGAATAADDIAADALALGVRLARTLQARVVLAGIWSSPLGAADAVYEGVVRAEMERELSHLQATVPGDLTCSVAIRGATSVVRGLHRVVEDVGAAILVLGPGRRGPAGRAAHGDIAAAAMQDAPCAIAVASPNLRMGGDAVRGEIVVGYDDVPESRAALEAAVELAEAAGAALRVVHVLETPYQLAGRRWAAGAAAEAWFGELRDRAHHVVEGAVSQVAGRVAVVGDVLEGPASTVLARAAGGALLLVVGSRGYGPLRRLVLGSTSSELIHRVSVPVLVVPRPPADAPGTAGGAGSRVAAARP